MTKIDEMTTDELWQEAEMWLDGIEDTLSHRCYPEGSLAGIRAIQLDVRKHLAWIDCTLQEIVLRRAEEGMTTAADAEFLRELLSLNDEKVVPNPVKRPFRPKSAS